MTGGDRVKDTSYSVSVSARAWRLTQTPYNGVGGLAGSLGEAPLCAGLSSGTELLALWDRVP
jgi:hypothetical protein